MEEKIRFSQLVSRKHPIESTWPTGSKEIVRQKRSTNLVDDDGQTCKHDRGCDAQCLQYFEKTRIYHGTKASSEMVLRGNDIIQKVISESNCNHLMYFDICV